MKSTKQSVSLFVSSLLLLVLVVISFWQTSLDFGDFRPSGSAETVVLWALSMLVVLGVFALGFIVFRSVLKLYIERRQGKWKESTANLEKAVELNPNDTWPLQNLYFNYQMQRQFDAAELTLDRALALRGSLILLRVRLGNWLLPRFSHPLRRLLQLLLAP